MTFIYKALHSECHKRDVQLSLSRALITDDVTFDCGI